MPGVYAQVQLDLATAPNAIAVPAEALDGSGDNHRVFVVDGAGTVQIRKVVTGIQSPAYVQIFSGVQPGDAVIVGRHSDYRQGQQVTPRFEDATTAPAAHS
jgi:membrane fusion protein (multidrug efflux system)